MKWETVYRGASLIALLISVIALCVAAYRTPELSFDYQGVLVGILSMLVTVLIGWNIYSLIDIRGFKKEFNDTLNDQRLEYVDLSKMINEGTIGVNNSLMISMYMIYDDRNKATRECCFVDYGIKAIGGYLHQDNVEGAQRVVDNLIVRIPELSLPIYPEQKIGMIEQLSEIKKVNGVEKIQNLPVLQKCILNWDVFPNNLE